MTKTTKSRRRPAQTAAFATVGAGLAALLLVANAFAAESGGDPARGGRLFLQCRACHAVTPGAPNGVGPNLYGVVGSKAGSRPGYHYSQALTASGIVWTPANLDKWLTEPTALVPGTNMAFQGVPSEKSRQDIIAYLETLKP